MKSQVGIEFITYVILLLIVLSILLYSATSRQYELISIKSNLEAKEMCDDISFEINEATRAGNGYERRFYVKENLFGSSSFNISIENYSVSIDWDGRSTSCSIITNNVVGTIDKGWDSINNSNGVIYVN
jgi:hypothetical protein